MNLLKHVKPARNYNWLLVVLILLEIYLALFSFNTLITSQFLNATLFTGVSLAFAAVLFVKFYQKDTEQISIPTRKKDGVQGWLFVALFVELLLYANQETIDIFKTWDPNCCADIIPSVVTMARRFLDGRFPYSDGALITYGYNTPPGYMPMHWLPYTIAEIFKFDHRSITFSIFIATAALLSIKAYWRNGMRQGVATLLLIFIAYIAICFSDRGGIMGITVEVMVGCYYALFINGLNSRKAVVTALFMGCCLLSHYYIAMWMPLYLFIMLASGSRKQLIMVLGCLVAFVCVVYVIPFLSKDWSSFWVAYKNNYEKVPEGEWKRLGSGDLPVHLYSGHGFAFLFYTHDTDGAVNQAVQHLLRFFLYANLVTLTLLAAVYWKVRADMNRNVFLMFSFKVFLTILMAFIVIPYKYLMITNFFVSIAIYDAQCYYIVRNKMVKQVA